MKIAFPIQTDQGLESPLNEHLGTAPLFLIVDSDTRDFQCVENQKIKDGSSCKSGLIPKEAEVEVVVTHCIGDGSLRNLNKADIHVYAAQEKTVVENLDTWDQGKLKLFHIFDLCQGKKNKKEGGCGHHH